MSLPENVGIHKLPQELTDRIFEHFYSQRDFTISYEKEYVGNGRRYEFKMQIKDTTYFKPHKLLLNQQPKVLASAERAYDLAPIDLHVAHDYKRGFTALQVISSNGDEYNKLRDQVKKITIGLDGKTRSASSLPHAYGLMAAKFPNLEEVVVYYRSLKHVYCSYSDYSETDDWQAFKPEKHKEGYYDKDLNYPA